MDGLRNYYQYLAGPTPTTRQAMQARIQQGLRNAPRRPPRDGGATH